MRIAGRYTFSYTTKRDFQVIGAVKIDLTYLMEGFWNGASQVPDTVTGYLAAAAGLHPLVDSAQTVLSSSGTGLLVFPAAPRKLLRRDAAQNHLRSGPPHPGRTRRHDEHRRV
jgi:hypothetical protein